MTYAISVEVDDLVLELNEDEMEAVNGDDWEYLWDLLSDKIANHMMRWGVITDVRER